jgi:hypothetical protein
MHVNQYLSLLPLMHSVQTFHDRGCSSTEVCSCHFESLGGIWGLLRDITCQNTKKSKKRERNALGNQGRRLDQTQHLFPSHDKRRLHHSTSIPGYQGRRQRPSSLTPDCSQQGLCLLRTNLLFQPRKREGNRHAHASRSQHNTNNTRQWRTLQET